MQYLISQWHGFSAYTRQALITCSAVAVLVVCVQLTQTSVDTAAPIPEPEFSAPPDFSAMRDIPAMKAAFFNYLRPIANYHNQALLRDRQRLNSIRQILENSAQLTNKDRQWLQSQAQTYGIDWLPENDLQMANKLLNPIDAIPIELVLVQAAKESGWGRSRFAKEANNYFGQWCYRPGCGIVPANRGTGKTHEVEKFASVSDAVRSYMHNINSHRTYRALRDIRAQYRQRSEVADGIALADGLLYYSERRQAYVDEVKSMIRQYRRFQQNTPE